MDEMKQQRALLVTQLRDHMNSDDITRVMIGESPTNQDSVIQDHLQKHRQVADIIRQNLTAQDNVLRLVWNREWMDEWMDGWMDGWMD